MERLLSVVLMAFFVLAPCAHADSILNINITYVTATMVPNDGSGDNLSFTLIGPGTTITAIAGMGCSDWCSGNPIPDLSSVFASQVFVSFFTSATVGGTTYNADTDISLSCCVFDVDGNLSSSVSGFVGEGETFKVVN